MYDVNNMKNISYLLVPESLSKLGLARACASVFFSKNDLYKQHLLDIRNLNEP